MHSHTHTQTHAQGTRKASSNTGFRKYFRRRNKKTQSDETRHAVSAHRIEMLHTLPDHLPGDGAEDNVVPDGEVRQRTYSTEREMLERTDFFDNLKKKDKKTEKKKASWIHGNQANLLFSIIITVNAVILGYVSECVCASYKDVYVCVGNTLSFGMSVCAWRCSSTVCAYYMSRVHQS